MTQLISHLVTAIEKRVPELGRPKFGSQVKRLAKQNVSNSLLFTISDDFGISFHEYSVPFPVRKGKQLNSAY